MRFLLSRSLNVSVLFDSVKPCTDVKTCLLPKVSLKKSTPSYRFPTAMQLSRIPFFKGAVKILFVCASGAKARPLPSGKVHVIGGKKYSNPNRRKKWVKFFGVFKPWMYLMLANTISFDFTF